MEEGSEDPPTRLIGNFLRKQRASGAEPSLDLDLEMEEHGRPPQRARSPRVSLEDEHQKHVSSDSDSDSDAGEVVRCKSTSTGTAAGPLLRAKTRSRLMDPPPAAAPVVNKKHKPSASRSPKPGQQSPSWRWSGPIDGEEEDPFVDEDIPDDFNLKRAKLGALTILQWVSLVLTVGALACSASIRVLSKKKVWELHLWKWELLALALVSGRLVSGWVIRIAMLSVGRNLLLRKRVLYFVYGVRSAVQNTLWLGLVLAAWHFLFDDKCQAAHMPVVSYVMKMLFCLLVATLIRLVKTLLLKVLASSFHVSTYFDRIQASLFNQYVTETLSGPQLVDHANVFAQQGQGSNKLTSKEKRQHQTADEGISIDKLNRLNRRNVSAWNMKRLMKIIRFGTLTTIDEQIKQATGEGDLSATHIRSEYESHMAAKKIFHNVAKHRSKYIYLADLMHFMRQEEAIKAMDLFEGGQEYNRISKRSLKNWMVNAFRERKALALTLNDTKIAVSKLNQMTNVVGGIIVFVLWLLILGIATTNFLVFLSSPFLVAIIVFGDTLKAIFEAIVFLFVMHPFDVGDRCEIEEVQVVVEEMNILTTVFLRYDNLKIYYPNNVLASIPIKNFYRSPDMGDGIDFYIHVATPVAKLALMKERILRYINNKKEHWYPGAMVILRDVDETNKLKISIWLCHTLNFQDMGMRYVRRELVLQEMIKVLKDLDIEYRMLPLDVNVRNAPPILSTRMPTTWNYC
ncbi:hypothetical protein ZWY2020_016185 [Hordeum vulgare]|nr:hypothetical protein ZWY2020_016185 [Hordeum vulgare]